MKINQINLFTNQLNEMISFYRDVLELNVINESAQTFTVEVGTTSLVFEQVEDSKPFYHFAMNIPENKFEEAKDWIQSKIQLNTENDSDEVFFETWNAHAIYFEDPSGNIVEFIARHNLNNAVNHRFSSDDLISISEIGVVVEKVIPFVRKLNERGIPNWKEDHEGLTPVGGEEGLFITVKEGRRFFFSQRKAVFFPLEVKVQGIGRFSFVKHDGNVTMTLK
ncbi:VOC family protein [Alteribacter aurantiacus]|uniref:VOC family protein n=1 Tax=Alteribacter aurantiacus TaxID=254410 RepID=UPI0004252B1B|nr:VOC family protein [Alteribacter aurantiacus]